MVNTLLWDFPFMRTWIIKSVLFYSMNIQIAAHLIDYDPEYTILDAREQLLQSNIQRSWILVCEPDNRTFPIIHKGYMTRNRTELCECSLSAGPYYSAQTKIMYNDVGSESGGIFQTKFPFNRIVLDYFSMFFT